ncbi:hypothetical protein N9D23_02225 [Rubripirellula sp.]|nr:hypothetical protein [Rubripirellula sp.]
MPTAKRSPDRLAIEDLQQSSLAEPIEAEHSGRTTKWLAAYSFIARTRKIPFCRLAFSTPPQRWGTSLSLGIPNCQNPWSDWGGKVYTDRSLQSAENLGEIPKSILSDLNQAKTARTQDPSEVVRVILSQ